MGILALIDADIAAYEAVCTSNGETVDWNNETVTKVPINLSDAIPAAKRIVETWAADAGCDDLHLALTGSRKFRKVVLPSYQANRAGKPRPAGLDEVKTALGASYPSTIIEGLEADDILGILATTDHYIGKSVVVSADKDLLTVPGVYFNPRKPRWGAIEITERQADWGWLYQTLIGDSSDGYKGCPKIGPVKAKGLLGPVGQVSLNVLWPTVLRAFRAAGVSEADAITQARMARILRRSDYDKTTKEIILWHPIAAKRERLALAKVRHA